MDAFIAKAYTADTARALTVASDLRAILGSEYGGKGPQASIVDGPATRSLVVAYILPKGQSMGPNSTSATIRAYSPQANRFNLVNSTGRALNGYGGLHSLFLPSPITGEIWVLLSAQMTGANGPNTRMRLYAFDNRTWRTVWAPPNAWGSFTLRTTKEGFRIDGDYYRSERKRHDRYSIARSGVTLQN